ncbi:uncharacterized protein LOC128222702 isoform X1 [Mya arenaria]|uniref:uncharacterized protein LOC128222702 isoform X1 n=1 Tax=Mya arenaria TaxID=6604 RepID=UPI0022DED304|nr:uncharacterized protein LOC128222702 isoform X1 [Mya arenaria]
MLLSVYFTVLVVSASVTVLVGAPGEADFIQIPPDRCLISLDDFYDKVVGNYYTSPLVITSGRIGQVDAKNLSQRANFLWSVLDDGRVVRTTGYWSSITNACFNLEEIWPNVNCNGAAFLPLGSGRAGDFDDPVQRPEFLISCDPENYLVRVFCGRPDFISNGVCTVGAAFLLVRDHRIDEDGEGFLDEEPDFSGTDWCKIDSLITECLGSRLKDWQWKMLLKHDCARPR